MSFAMLGLLDPLLIVYLVLFFLIAYLLFAAVFSAVGAAVNEMREAQSLMTPVMLVLMAPWLFATADRPRTELDVQRRPQLHPAGQHLRHDDPARRRPTPPPTGRCCSPCSSAWPRPCVVTWFAAKIFKVGLLMHGKPPNMSTR